jgi:glycosyltransferase involved in cell wall biosynthesis
MSPIGAETSVRAGEHVDRVASFPGPIPQNPYQRLLYGALAAEGIELVRDTRLKLDWLLRSRDHVDTLHFHWPQGYYRHERGPRRLRRPLSWLRLSLFAGRLAAARALGYRVAWTVHQVYPHETRSPRQDRIGALLLARASHVLIAHDLDTAAAVQAEFGRSASVIPHGSYVGVYQGGQARSVVRAGLGIPDDAFVFLCLGHLRAYKAIEGLLDSFRALADRNLVLVVAGLAVDDSVAEKIKVSAGVDPRIRPLLEFIPDERVAKLFEACDVAVVPRRDGGTSGSLILALSLGRPVVAARTSAYEALTGGEEAGWLFDMLGADSLRDTLARTVVERDSAREKGAAALERARRMSWGEVAKRTAPLLRRDGRADVLLVCSSGGHLLQMLALSPAWEGFSRVWVTNDKSDARSLLDSEPALFLRGPYSRNLPSLIRNFGVAWRVVGRVRPQVVISTGADLAVPFAWVARMRGARVTYVESFTRINTASLSCRLIAPACDRIYVQWPELLESVSRARYAGAVVSSA